MKVAEGTLENGATVLLETNGMRQVGFTLVGGAFTGRLACQQGMSTRESILAARGYGGGRSR